MGEALSDVEIVREFQRRRRALWRLAALSSLVVAGGFTLAYFGYGGGAPVVWLFVVGVAVTASGLVPLVLCPLLSGYACPRCGERPRAGSYTGVGSSGVGSFWSLSLNPQACDQCGAPLSGTRLAADDR